MVRGRIVKGRAIKRRTVNGSTGNGETLNWLQVGCKREAKKGRAVIKEKKGVALKERQ